MTAAPAVHRPAATFNPALQCAPIDMPRGDFWRGIFGNDRPVSIEIGPGRGEFLLAATRADPMRNFMGIEFSSSRARLTQAYLKNCPNIRLLHGNAACLLSLFPDACVDAYHIQFPDPWWKRRHHRRRLLTSSFVATLARTLAEGGTIELLTDVAEYFDLAQRHLANDARLRCETSGPWAIATTSFARKAHAQGRDIYRSIHRRYAESIWTHSLTFG